jgi:hypothetical protein
LQGRRQRVDEGLGGGVVFADEFAAHELDAIELGRLEAELFANFFADAPEVVGIKQDFGRVELFTDDGKVLGDAWGAGLFGGFFVSGNFSRPHGPKPSPHSGNSRWLRSLAVAWSCFSSASQAPSQPIVLGRFLASMLATLRFHWKPFATSLTMTKAIAVSPTDDLAGYQHSFARRRIPKCQSPEGGGVSGIPPGPLGCRDL